MAAPDDIFAGTSIITTRVQRTINGGKDDSPSDLTLTEMDPSGNKFTDQTFNSKFDDLYETPQYVIKSDVLTFSPTLPGTNNLDASYNPTDEPIYYTSNFVDLGEPTDLPKYSDFVQVSGYFASDLSERLFDGGTRYPLKAQSDARQPYIRWYDGTNSGLSGKVRVYMWYEGYGISPGGLTYYYKINDQDVVPTFEPVSGDMGWVTLQDSGPFNSFQAYHTNVGEVNCCAVEVDGEVLIDVGRKIEIFFDNNDNFDLVTLGETLLIGTITGKRYMVVNVNPGLNSMTVVYRNAAGDPLKDTPENFQMINSIYKKQNHAQIISGNVGTADESFLPNLAVNHYSASTLPVATNAISECTYVFADPPLDDDGNEVRGAFSVGVSNKITNITDNIMDDPDTIGHWYSSHGLSYTAGVRNETINTERWFAGDVISVVCDYPDSKIYYFKNGKVYDVVEMTAQMKSQPLHFCSNIFIQGNVTVTYGTLDNITTRYLTLSENDGNFDVSAAGTNDPGYVNMPEKDVDITFPSDL